MRRSKRSKNKEDESDPLEDNGFAAFGGYMEAKKAKLLQQFRHQTTNLLENKSDIFSGVKILVNGYTKPSAEELKELIGQHGGTYHQYQVLGGGTTHIIASNLPNVKINKLGSVPIVKPNWIVDSIETGYLLDYKKYLLYTNQSRTQPRLNLPTIDKPTAETILCANKVDNNAKASTQINFDISKIDHTHSNTEVSASNIYNDRETELITSVKKALIANINSNEPSKRAKDATDPTFLSDFYNNSRLHLIATLGAEFKQLVNQLREKSDGKFEGLDKLKDINIKNVENFNCGSDDKVIMHIDMDCFFVSVGCKNRPELRGKPVAVTHSRGNKTQHRTGVDRQAEIDMYEKRLPDKTDSRLGKVDNTCSLSEIASCSYEARKCGIKNGMFMGPALQLCADLIAIPYDFECYKEVSNSLYKTIAKYSLNIEAVSCDEMYVDVTNILNVSNFSVEDWATYIRQEISDVTGCPCSTGFGSNRLQARMATKKAKPNGQFHLKLQEVENYFYDTQVGDLPGVGYATLSKLKGMGIETCGDVQNYSLQDLQSKLGQRSGTQLFEQSKGIDKKPLQYEHERKSVSAEMNYGIRFKSTADVYDFFENLSKEVHSRLQETGLKSRCVTLKLMIRAAEAPVETAKYLGHGVCDSISRSSTLNFAMCDNSIILKETKSLFEKLKVIPEDIRGVGIQLSRLEKTAPVNKLLSNFLNNAKVQQSTDSDYLKNKSDVNEPTENKIEDIQSKAQNSNKIDVTISKNSERQKTVQKPKGRGRPRKFEKSESKGPTNKLGNYFKVKGHSAENASDSMSSSQNDKIDLTVLNELPDDIRNEIMKEYSIKSNDDGSTENELKQVKNKVDKSLGAEELDKDFLAALPEDIRKEVMADHKLKTSIANTKKSSCERANVTSAKYTSIKPKRNSKIKRTTLLERETKSCDTSINRQILKRQETNKNDDRPQKIFEDLDNLSVCEEFDFSAVNPDDFKVMLNNWLKTEKTPLEYDTKLLSKYFYQLAVSRKIEVLFRFMKFLTRNINKKTDCSWHKSYYMILNHLQEGMVTEYNHSLFIPEKINCMCSNETNIKV